jgi:hypothetical protein
MDVKKQVEELARAAGIAAQGEVALCTCSTCNVAVSEVEEIMEALTKSYCSTVTFAVFAIGLHRIRAIVARNQGLLHAALAEARYVNMTRGLGMSEAELSECFQIWSEIDPKPEPEVK